MYSRYFRLTLFVREYNISIFFQILKCTLICGSGIFLRVQFQKIGDFGCMRASHERQSFHFQKITGALKLTFFGKFAETFLIHQRKILKNRI